MSSKLIQKREVWCLWYLNSRDYEMRGLRYPGKHKKHCITFIQRRPNVFDVGPTLYKCYTNVWCLLGYYCGECCGRTICEMYLRPGIRIVFINAHVSHLTPGCGGTGANYPDACWIQTDRVQSMTSHDGSNILLGLCMPAVFIGQIHVGFL